MCNLFAVDRILVQGHRSWLVAGAATPHDAATAAGLPGCGGLDLEPLLKRSMRRHMKLSTTANGQACQATDSGAATAHDEMTNLRGSRDSLPRPESVGPELFTMEDGSYCTDIMVVGIGRFGINVINSLTQRQILGVSRTIAIDTDADALDRSLAAVNIQLGDGSRSDGFADVARILAWQQREEIRKALVGASMVMVVTGLGGGTGSGVAHVVARIARQTGALTLTLLGRLTGVAVSSSTGENRWVRRMLLQSHAVIDMPVTETMRFKIVTESPTGPIEDGVEKSLEIVKGIAMALNVRGLVCIDLEDIRSVLTAGLGPAYFAVSESSGESRAEEAARGIVDCPRMNKALARAAGIFIWIAAGPELTLAEVKSVIDMVRIHATKAATIAIATVWDVRLKPGALRIGVVTRCLPT